MSEQFNRYIVNLSLHWKEKPTLVAYIREVEEKESPGLISIALEWMSEGWELPDPTPCVEQLAAALFMESNDSSTEKEWCKTLRGIAYKILRLAGHVDPMIEDYRDAHNKLGSAHERKGNIQESVNARRVAGMLHALSTGENKFMFHPSPEEMEARAKEDKKNLVDATAVYHEVRDLSRHPCKIDSITNIVLGDKLTAELAYIELADGTKLMPDDIDWAE